MRNIISYAFILVDKHNFKYHHGKTRQFNFHLIFLHNILFECNISLAATTATKQCLCLSFRLHPLDIYVTVYISCISKYIIYLFEEITLMVFQLHQRAA